MSSGPLARVLGVFGVLAVGRQDELDLFEHDRLGVAVQLQDQLLDLCGGAVAVRPFRGVFDSGQWHVLDQGLHGDLQGLCQRGELGGSGNALVVLVACDLALLDARRRRQLDLGQVGLLAQLFESGTDAHLQIMWGPAIKS